jgi:hypothetical protein
MSPTGFTHLGGLAIPRPVERGTRPIRTLGDRLGYECPHHDFRGEPASTNHASDQRLSEQRIRPPARAQAAAWVASLLARMGVAPLPGAGLTRGGRGGTARTRHVATLERGTAEQGRLFAKPDRAAAPGRSR